MLTPSQLESSCQSADLDTGSVSNRALADWLCWLHEMLADSAHLILFRIKPNQAIEVVAEDPVSSPSIEGLNNAVLSCVHRQKAIYLDSLPASVYKLLAIPFQVESTGTGYVLVMLTGTLNQIQQNVAVKLTRWAATRIDQERTGTPEDSRLDMGPEAQLSQALMASLDQHGTFTSLAFTLVNTLAGLCGCSRVSLGAYEGKKWRLVAMSGQSKIDDRRLIARQLVSLMEETLSSRRLIYPGLGDESAPAFQTYYKSQGAQPLLGFVMPGTSATRFVLVLERAESVPYMDAQATAIEQSVYAVAALLELAQTHELPLHKKVSRFASGLTAGLVNYARWSGKQWLAAVACTALLLSFLLPTTHRVSADAMIEASDRQVLVAAQDGFILSAHARAGELVDKGDLLATLDVQDLELALEKWRSEKIKNQQEYAQALAIHNRSELSRLRADVQRIDAEVALLEQQLRRSEVRAPFDGVLLEGDWTQSLGAPVKTGDVLFEIASAEQYRLILEIDEHDIGYIMPEQQADLRMSALPTTIWQAQLADVIPVAISEKGSSAFRVPAIINGNANALRPGMEGVGKVNVGQRSMFWVYSHKLVDKLRLLAWKVGLL